MQSQRIIDDHSTLERDTKTKISFDFLCLNHTFVFVICSFYENVGASYKVVSSTHVGMRAFVYLKRMLDQLVNSPATPIFISRKDCSNGRLLSWRRTREGARCHHNEGLGRVL